MTEASRKAENRPGKTIYLRDLVRTAIECGLLRAADGGGILLNGEPVDSRPSPSAGE
jgi:hypothetical protein